MDAVALAWSSAVDRVRPHWRRLRPLAPYLIALALPGSFVWVPLVVCWEQRRRARS